MTSTYLWHNGELKDETAPVFTATDRIRLGDGVFDTILAVDNRLIHADLHLKRLLDNAAILKSAPLPSAQELKENIANLLLKNNYVKLKYAINTIISRGEGQRGLALPDNPKPNIIIRAAPAPTEHPPIHAIIAETVRRNEGSPLSQIKSLNYGDNILALKEANERGANEAILYNNQGNITCSTAGNIVITKQNQLITPPLSDGVLNGITRQILMEKYDVQEQSLIPKDLEKSDGIYITNSVRGAVPISSLNGQPLPPPSLNIDKDFHLS